MSTQQRIIDFLDVIVRLPHASVPQLEETLQRFVTEYNFVEIEPKIKDGRLLINSTDLIAYLGYISPDLLTEFEKVQFRQNIIDALDQLLLRAVNTDFRSHYKWCIAAVKNLELGRYLDS